MQLTSTRKTSSSAAFGLTVSMSFQLNLLMLKPTSKPREGAEVCRTRLQGPPCSCQPSLSTRHHISWSRRSGRTGSLAVEEGTGVHALPLGPQIQGSLPSRWGISLQWLLFGGKKSAPSGLKETYHCLVANCNASS